jgi:hypothetical protein
MGNRIETGNEEHMERKRLEEILRENTKPSRIARRLATFLSLWDEIQEAYKNGWTYKEIWGALHREGIIDFGYSAFLHRVQKRNRVLLATERAAKEKSTVPAKPDNQSGIAIPSPITPAPSGSTRVDMPRFGEGLPPRPPKKF